MDDRLRKKVKVVQYEGRRRSFRLERIFWDILSDIAKRRNVKLGKLISDIDLNDSSKNLTSVLRVECVLELERQLSALKLRRTPDQTDLVDLCPSPCVVLSEAATILGGNKSYTKLFLSSERDLIGIRFWEVFQVRTSIDFEEFWFNLKRRPKRPLSAHVVFSTPAGAQSAQAIFIPDTNAKGAFLGAAVWLSNIQ